MNIVKLSEANLKGILGYLFPDSKITPQFRLEKYRIDYVVEVNNQQLYIEFDGPTHYVQTKTQLRDIIVENMIKEQSGVLIRIPYFVQLNSNSVDYFFGEYTPINGVSSEYQSGFIDEKCILPADYNQRGWELFFNLYSDMVNCCSIVPKQIYENARNMYSKEQFLGISDRQYYTEFWNHYPT